MNRVELLVLSIVIFLTVVAWVVFSIYQAQTQPALEAQSVLEIDIPKEKLDVQVLEILLKKQP